MLYVLSNLWNDAVKNNILDFPKFLLSGRIQYLWVIFTAVFAAIHNYRKKIQVRKAGSVDGADDESVVGVDGVAVLAKTGGDDVDVVVPAIINIFLRHNINIFLRHNIYIFLTTTTATSMSFLVGGPLSFCHPQYIPPPTHLYS